MALQLRTARTLHFHSEQLDRAQVRLETRSALVGPRDSGGLGHTVVLERHLLLRLVGGGALRVQPEVRGGDPVTALVRTPQHVEATRSGLGVRRTGVKNAELTMTLGRVVTRGLEPALRGRWIPRNHAPLHVERPEQTLRVFVAAACGELEPLDRRPAVGR